MSSLSKKKWILPYIETVLLVGIVIAFICIIILNTHLKKMNSIIKRILVGLCIHNVLGFMIALFIYIFWQDDNMDKTICCILFFVAKSIGVMTFECLSIISIVRYQIFWKTANAKSFRRSAMAGFILFLYIVEYSGNHAHRD